MNNSTLKEDSLRQATSIGSKPSCIAWFKLAELVTRKEKEKALSLYRLLSHSFENRAYALQLEADILWSLEDEQALGKYEQAAYLYKKEQKIISSIAVYEHLLTLQPKNYDFLSRLLILYTLISWQEKFEERYLVLLKNHLEGTFSQDQVFNISQKIISFIVPINKRNKNFNLLEELEEQQLDTDNFNWILNSLASILKDKNFSNVKERIKDYCSEFELDFNT